MSTAESDQCTSPGCQKGARMAVRTTRPSRSDLRSTIHFDDRGAPKAAQRFCKEHGNSVVVEMIKLLVTEDS